MIYKTELKDATIRAYLIDPYSETISEVAFNGDFHQIHELIDCQVFDVFSLDAVNDVYVDDEGLLNLTNESKFFLWRDYPQPIVGKGLVLGHDEDGNAISPTVSVDYVAFGIEFLTHAQAMAYATEPVLTPL